VAQSTPAPNLYAIEPEDWVLDIYNYSKLPDDPASPGRKFREARHAAFRILGKQAHRWSDFVNLKLSNGDVVRITITYLSPQLIETILLNNAIREQVPQAPPEAFKDSVHQELIKLGNRSEILFLFTITSTRYTDSLNGDPPITVDIPLSNLVVTNSSNMNANTKRDDHSLDQFIQLAQGPVSGIISYQMTVKNGENCLLFLDPQVNNTISIHLEGITVNGLGRDPQTWTIRYKSLLGGDGLDVNPQYVDINPLPTYWLPSSEAPTPQTTIPPNVAGEWDPYWEKLACYIWEQVMFANSP
jgi:hypothetical protein